jgi:hypothetical protein
LEQFRPPLVASFQYDLIGLRRKKLSKIGISLLNALKMGFMGIKKENILKRQFRSIQLSQIRFGL